MRSGPEARPMLSALPSRKSCSSFVLGVKRPNFSDEEPLLRTRMAFGASGIVGSGSAMFIGALVLIPAKYRGPSPSHPIEQRTLDGDPGTAPVAAGRGGGAFVHGGQGPLVMWGGGVP